MAHVVMGDGGGHPELRGREVPTQAGTADSGPIKRSLGLVLVPGQMCGDGGWGRCL
jgi:hypothetical protein